MRMRWIAAAVLAAAVAALLAVLLSAPTVADGATTLRIRADASAPKFNKTSLRARVGSVTIVMTNPRNARAPHAVSIKGGGVRRNGNVVNAGGTSRVRATLKRGTYTFFCPVAGHEAAGMKGRLTVR
jgi:plastocyanin